MSEEQVLTAATHGQDGHGGAPSNRVFGLWIYIMTDAIIFASLFATCAVLSKSFAGGPTGRQIFDLPLVLIETLFLLTSSFTCGLAIISFKTQRSVQTVIFLGATLMLGGVFVGIEISEFAGLVAEGFGPDRSAFLSAFFALVGTHGLHVAIGLLWIIVLMVRIARRGSDAETADRLMGFSLYWHFLDIIWICVFTIVYLMGASA